MRLFSRLSQKSGCRIGLLQDTAFLEIAAEGQTACISKIMRVASEESSCCPTSISMPRKDEAEICVMVQTLSGDYFSFLSPKTWKALEDRAK